MKFKNADSAAKTLIEKISEFCPTVFSTIGSPHEYKGQEVTSIYLTCNNIKIFVDIINKGSEYTISSPHYKQNQIVHLNDIDQVVFRIKQIIS